MPINRLEHILQIDILPPSSYAVDSNGNYLLDDVDKKRVMYSYAQVDKSMERAYTVVEAGKILGRHRVTIEEYILQGKIKQPQKVYPISNPESTWSKYMLSESDILDIYAVWIFIGIVTFYKEYRHRRRVEQGVSESQEEFYIDDIN